MSLYNYAARVKRVVDGDTVDVTIDLGFKVYMDARVRIIGINAPETYGVKKESQEYQDGMKAKERLMELIDGKDVILNTHKDKKGKYGRYLADIFVDDTSVADILLQEGLVTRY